LAEQKHNLKRRLSCTPLLRRVETVSPEKYKEQRVMRLEI